MLQGSPTTPAQVRYFSKVGELAYRWNGIERLMQEMATFLVGTGLKSDAAITHLGNVSLMETIKALSETQTADVRDTMAFSCKLFDACRVIRNYYVHGPIFFEVEATEVTGCGVRTVVHKGLLKEETIRITLSDLETCNEQFEEAYAYIYKSMYRILGQDRSHTANEPSPKKPAVPKGAAKHRKDLIRR